MTQPHLELGALIDINADIVAFVDVSADEMPFEQHELDPLITYFDTHTQLGEHLYDPFDDDALALCSSQVQRWVARLRGEMEARSPDLCYFRVIPKQQAPRPWTDESVAQFVVDLVRAATSGTLRTWEPRHVLALIKEQRQKGQQS